MFRRLRLPGKLALAAVPLVFALSGVSFLFAQTTFAEAAEERRAADLALVLGDVRAAIDAVAAESTAPEEGRVRTDEDITRLRTAITAVDAPPLLRQLDAASRRLEAVRASGVTGDARSLAAYDQVASDLLSVASLIPAEVANPESARSLEGLGAIGRARQVARIQRRALTGLATAGSDVATLDRVRDLEGDFTGWADLFHTVATPEARTIFAQSGAPVAIGGVSTQVGRLLDDPAGSSITVADWHQLLDNRSMALATFEERLTEVVARQAAVAADHATTRAWVVVAAAGGALLLAAIMTTLISRSVVRRVRSVTERAQHVAQEQLPALVEALRDPGEDAALPSLPPIRDRGADEIGDLARSFSAMQSTLQHVAEQQVETLRKGVADMFVTLARRNRSLIDRQLALIDELEADEEDPEALADYYRLDHIATRMRRNAESLLVLAGSEPARVWKTPLGIDDVVRAAIGEIEDYRRVDVLTLETVRLKGSVVADLSHLLSELLENAAQFSPPQSRVRVSGHFHEEGYLITVSDRGVGIPEARLSELNRLLERPPVVGLALEPTLGLYVVAMLGRRHGIQARLVPGAPGVSAKLLVSPKLFDTVEVPEPTPPTPPNPRSTVAFAPGDQGRHATAERHAVRTSARVSPPRPRPTAPSPAPTGAPNFRVPAAIPQATPPSTHVPVAGSAPQANPVPFAPALEAPTRMGSAPDAAPGGLPVRRPGMSYAADPEAERPVTAAPRAPEAVRSKLGAFQTGLDAGRRHSQQGEHE